MLVWKSGKSSSKEKKEAWRTVLRSNGIKPHTRLEIISSVIL